MSRAALLPTPGDPYIVAAWLQHYKNIWKDEVDKLYIHFNSRLEKPVMDYITSLAESMGADCSYTKNWMGHGEALKVIFDRSTEDHVLLIEDDGYILQKGATNKFFKFVESGNFDAVVNGRASCSMELLEKERQVFNLQGNMIHLPHFWPCFFFSHKKTLQDTDQNFAAKNWNAGDTIVELDNWVTPTNLSADTLGWVSLQLRYKKYRFFYVPDGRSTTEDYWLWDRKMGIFADPPIAPWIHFGSTSSGISGTLLDDEMKPLENRERGVPGKLPTMPDDHIRDDYARRIALWKLCWKLFPIPQDNPAEYFNEIYGRSLDRCIKGCGLEIPRIEKYMRIYATSLAESLRE
jgi:hypothetical protein